MGHEFSHILNGDMRLNLRLIGIVYGILVLAVIGYYLMRSAGYVSSGDSRRRRRRRRGVLLARTGAGGAGLSGRVPGQADQERHQPAAGVPGRRLVGAVHAQPRRNRRGAEEDRRPGRGLADPRRPRRGNQPHVLRRRLRRLASSISSPRIRRWPSASGPLEPDFDGRFPAVAAGGDRAEAASSGAGSRPAASPRRPPAPPPPRRSWPWTPGTSCGGSASRRPSTCDHAGQMVGAVAAAAAGRRPRAVHRPGGHLCAAVEPRRRGHPHPATATAPSADRAALVPADAAIAGRRGASLAAAARLPLVDLACRP